MMRNKKISFHGRSFLGNYVHIRYYYQKTTQGRRNRLRDNNIIYVLTSREKGSRRSKAFVIIKVCRYHCRVLELKSNPFIYIFMASDERPSTRSPTTSRTDSYRDGLGSRTNANAYNRRSSITDGNDNEYEEPGNDVDDRSINDIPPQRREDQYIAALRHRFPNRPKTDYSYSRPVGPTISRFKLNNS
jgi:hypothetical protein